MQKPYGGRGIETSKSKIPNSLQPNTALHSKFLKMFMWKTHQRGNVQNQPIAFSSTETLGPNIIKAIHKPNIQNS